MRKNLLIGFLLIALLLSSLLLYLNHRSNQQNIEETANIIVEKIESINELMVLESSFSEIYTYKQEDKVFFDLYPVEKEVILIVNAKVRIGYDLNLMDYQLDLENKVLIIQSIPKENIIIEPTIQYYDIRDSQLYPLNAKDFTTIQKRSIELIRNQVIHSDMIELAEKNLNKNLNDLFFLTEQAGWKVVKP